MVTIITPAVGEGDAVKGTISHDFCALYALETILDRVHMTYDASCRGRISEAAVPSICGIHDDPSIDEKNLRATE